MALLLFQLRIVFTVGLLLGPASVWAGGGVGTGAGARAAVRGAALRLACPAPDPRSAAASKPKHSNMLDIGAAYGAAPPAPPAPPPPLVVLKEEDFYYDSNDDSELAAGTEEIELYPDAGRGAYDDDVADGFPERRQEEEAAKKRRGKKKKPETKRLEAKKPKPTPAPAPPPPPPPPEPVSYVWFHNGTELPANGSKRHVLEDGSLHFKKFGGRRGQDVGHYRCLAVGAHGAMLSTATVLSFAGMNRDFTLYPVDKNVSEGDAFQFSCEIQSNPTANITWEKNSQLLPENKRYYFLTTGALLITNAQKEDSGDYRCIAVNSFLNKTKYSPTGRVSVVKSTIPNYPLSFVSENENDNDLDNTTMEIRTKNVFVYYGDNVSLGCAVSGKPKPKVIWNFQSDSSETQAKEISSMEVYRIMGVKEENGGLYTCVATNEQQSIQQAYRVSVLLAPFLKQTPTSEHTPTAKTVRFNCSAGGSPPPQIMWYKDGRPLNITGRVKLKSQDKKPPELIVSDTISSDKGVYQCIASNAAGEASGWALLAVRALNVPPPSLVRCRPLARDTVRITWEAPLHLPAVAYTVHFMLADGGEEHSQILTSKIYDLRKLEPFRSYEFYTKTYTNRRGASDQSPHVVCHGQGIDIFLASVGNSSMHVSWRESAPNVKMWQLQWRLIGINTTINNVTLPQNASSYLVEDIQPLNKYEFRLLASPSDSWLPQDLGLILWTSAANRTIHPYKDPGPRGSAPFDADELDVSSQKQLDWEGAVAGGALRPAWVHAEPTGPRSVNVSWRCDAAEASSDGYFFILCYMQRPEEGDEPDAPAYRERCIESLNSWTEIMGLEPETLYGFKVQAVMQNQRRRGPFSETTICRTKHEVWSAVTDVRWELLKGGVVQVSWAHKGSPGEALYTVYYSQDPLAPLPQWAARNVTNSTQLQLPDLNTDSVCYVMVSLRGEERGRVITIPPQTKVDVPVEDKNSVLPTAEENTSSERNFGIILGVSLSVFFVIIFANCILWHHRKRLRQQQGAAAPIRTNRVARSDFECQELMGQPPSVDSKFNTKKHIPNGNCRPLLGKEATGPVYDGTLDVSRYEELPDITVETILEHSTADPCYSEAPSVSPLSANHSQYSVGNDSDTIAVPNGVRVHVDRNSNSEVANIKKIKDNEIYDNDKVIILDAKSGSINYNKIEESNPEKALRGGPNTKLENAKNNSSVDAAVTLDYRENGSVRRWAPALGPNG